MWPIIKERKMKKVRWTTQNSFMVSEFDWVLRGKDHMLGKKNKQIFL